MGTNLDVFNFLSPAQAPDEMGRLGPYRVLAVLGQGGMGVVFQAEDPQLQRIVALKAMLPEVAKRPAARERFLREARATAKIEHDHIVTIYQVGEDRGVPFLAMQLLKGMSLEAYLRKKQGKTGKPLPLDYVIKVGRETAKGLAAAHEKGLIHRDIKPANIWLDANAGGRVKILDFGLAQANEGDATRLTKLGTIVGSPSYMAPEQARSDKIDARADLFSLGCVLYRLCTGRLPFRGEDAVATMLAALTEEPPPIRDLNPEVPPKLAELVRKCLAKKPDDRPASARAVIDALQAIEVEQPTQSMKKLALPAAEPVAAAPTTWQEPGEATARLARRPPPRRSGGKLLILATLAALLVLATTIAAGAFFYFHTDTGTLKIDLAGNDVQVIIERNGAKIDVIDSKKSHVTLPPGDYHLRLGEPRKDIRLDRDNIQVARDDTAVVTITKVKDVASNRPTAVPPPPTRRPPPPPPPDPVTRPKETPDPVTRPKETPDPAVPATVTYITNSIGMKLAPIQPGEFLMGAAADEIARYKVPDFARTDETPQHRVRITRSFQMGAHPVTVGQFRQFVKDASYKPTGGDTWAKPGFDQTDDHPVVGVTWNDAVAFCKWLSKKEGRGYRLPTDAEWEYCCRAGSTTAYPFGDDPNQLPKHAWFRANTGKGTHPVGKLPANAWGLYDMPGHVWQWVEDWYTPDYYKNSPAEDPSGPATGFKMGDKPAKVMRGGSWVLDAIACRSACRKGRPADYKMPHAGFRVVCDK
jgi:formylglycine-generating enzyme required for sulfatase activity